MKRVTAFAITLILATLASIAAETPVQTTGATTETAEDKTLVDGVAAFVNGEAITIRDVVTGIPDQLRAMASDPAMREKSQQEVFEVAFKASLEECIDRRLIIQEYWDGEQRIPDSALVKSLNEVVESRYNGDVAALQSDLAKSRLTYSDWKKIMEEQIIIRSMRQSFVNANIHISPNEIASAYTGQKSQLTEPEKIKVLTFALASGDTFEDNLAIFRKRLADGDEFEAIAKALSVDAMAEAGGDYGWIVPDEVLAPVLASAIKALKDGEMSAPLTLGDKQYIVFRKASRPSKTLTLREAQEQIERGLYEKEAQRLYESWIARLRSSAQIKLFESI